MILWSIGCLLTYFDKYSIGIKIRKLNEGQLLLVNDFVRTYAETVTVTDLMSTTRKICIKSFSIN